MKVKHIISTFGILFGGLVLAQGANAVVTMEGHSDVQFTFGSTLALTLSSTLANCPAPYSDPTFCIEDLSPGTSGISNTVTANVLTNNATGYNLSATVGGADSQGDTYTTTSLTSTEHTDVLAMIGASATALSAGTWGYTLDAGTTYGALDLSTSKTLNQTVDAAGTAATGYGGTSNTNIQIGAYAAIAQKSGAYRNVINFTATTNVLTRTVNIATNGADVTSATITAVDGSAITPTISGTYSDGQVLSVTATCATGKNFLGWAKSYDFGQLANMDSATTTYTVGNGDITLTAYCN